MNEIQDEIMRYYESYEQIAETYGQTDYNFPEQEEVA
jgi:hypothetical protein